MRYLWRQLCRVDYKHGGTFFFPTQVISAESNGLRLSFRTLLRIYFKAIIELFFVGGCFRDSISFRYCMIESSYVTLSNAWYHYLITYEDFIYLFYFCLT